MEVTSVDLNPVETGGERLLAFASVVFDEEFVVHNIRLVRAESGVIAAMPNEEYRGELRDIAHPLNNDCRERICAELIRDYNEQVSESREIPL